MRRVPWPFLLAGIVLIWLTASQPALAAEGNTLRGETVYARCLACHALAYDRTGPRHCGLFGRRAGSVPGFAYSKAMKNADIVWDEETLDVFLAAPMDVVPGTSMGYAGISDAQERSDLIAYLKQKNASPLCTGE